MGKQPFISHAVNGYSRYDVPESKAFTCTPGILYPVRIDFINARDRVSIEQGIDVRSNPLAVPTFNPYTIRLHRFWVPLQLYHAEMRTNSSKFDMNDLSLNWIPTSSASSYSGLGNRAAASNSLLFWLRLASANRHSVTATDFPGGISLSSDKIANINSWSNADVYLAYWDIVRNYYSYSQWGLYSFVWPAAWYPLFSKDSALTTITGFNYLAKSAYFNQRFGSLEFLDAYFESQFYPSSVNSENLTYNRSSLFFQIGASDLVDPSAASSDGYPVTTTLADSKNFTVQAPANQFSSSGTSGSNFSPADLFVGFHPLAVVPSNPDRLSRLLPPSASGSAVSMTGVHTIPQLAIASRLQEYKDLLGAGGNRYSDWLETFFASKIEHVDRPKLLFSASQTVNVQIVMNQAGQNNFAGTSSNGPLGQQGGAIAFNDRLGRRQSYYFREPGYMIDMLSIRPVYFWAGIKPDWANYSGPDYFNPIYNDIGYQDVPNINFYSASTSLETVAREPAFNEFRSSYDEVLGQISVFGSTASTQNLYAYWVQQRTLSPMYNTYYAQMFVDIGQVNSPFVSNIEDNFFINLSYSIQKKNLVNKTFATRLSNR